MLSFVSISSLLSQDSPDTERTSSAGTHEASKPQRDFTRMTSNDTVTILAERKGDPSSGDTSVEPLPQPLLGMLTALKLSGK